MIKYKNIDQESDITKYVHWSSYIRDGDVIMSPRLHVSSFRSYGELNNNIDVLGTDILVVSKEHCTLEYESSSYEYLDIYSCDESNISRRTIPAKKGSFKILGEIGSEKIWCYKNATGNNTETYNIFLGSSLMLEGVSDILDTNQDSLFSRSNLVDSSLILEVVNDGLVDLIGVLFKLEGNSILMNSFTLESLINSSFSDVCCARLFKSYYSSIQARSIRNTVDVVGYSYVNEDGIRESVQILVWLKDSKMTNPKVEILTEDRVYDEVEITINLGVVCKQAIMSSKDPIKNTPIGYISKGEYFSITKDPSMNYEEVPDLQNSGLFNCPVLVKKNDSVALLVSDENGLNEMIIEDEDFFKMLSYGEIIVDTLSLLDLGKYVSSMRSLAKEAPCDTRFELLVDMDNSVVFVKELPEKSDLELKDILEERVELEKSVRELNKFDEL